MLSRLLATGASTDPLHCGRSQPLDPQLCLSGVQLPFSLVQGLLSRVGRQVTQIACHVSIVSELVSSVPDEVALLSRPLVFHLG